VEEFILAEAVKAGVVSRIELRPGPNPNKWDKKMAPWYTEECREARKAKISA
jgi:hypothetical protein